MLLGNSLDVIKRIPDNSIDFILTDPPYNLGKHSTGNIPLPGRSAMNNDVAAWDLIDFNPEDWADDFIRILKPTGNLFIFTSYNQLGRWYNCLDHRFDTSNFMIWHKTNPAPKVFKAGFLNSCEMIFTCWNKKHTWNFISQAEMHNFIESPICMRPERLSNPNHPTQKPVVILKKMIEIATNKDDIIFDPFMGVGSTGVAALRLGRRFIGVELDKVYFQAAQERINKELDDAIQVAPSKYDIEQSSSMVGEDLISYLQPSLFEMEEFFGRKNNKHVDHEIDENQELLPPIIKWPGGKEKELKYIIPNLPKFDRYFEPFVGGGSVYMGISANAYFINDFSTELIELYRNIASSNDEFFHFAALMDASWHNSVAFFKSNVTLVETYIKFRNEVLSKAELLTEIKSFCEDMQERILAITGSEINDFGSVLVKEMEVNLFRKMVRMRKLEMEKHELPEKDLYDNIETAIKSAVYMNYRYLYNKRDIEKHSKKIHSALFFFMRNYAYSGMFRYSSKGEFNVPYGGIAYNSKYLAKKLDYYHSKSLLNHFNKTQIYNLDFEDFLRRTQPSENDFIFLDPPYDSEFSTYAQNDFTKDDQKRLANYLINECKAQWMMIIKNTDFIYGLYHNKEGISVKMFDKEYTVSFMNRNEKKVTHLLITNYAK